jgi:hypothetical protein
MLDLARVPSNPQSSGSADGGSDIGSEEINFEAMWNQIAANGSGYMMTESVGITPGGRIGVVPAISPDIAMDVQGIGDSMMGMYGKKSTVFGGN